MTHILSKEYTKDTIFDTFGGTVPPWDLSIPVTGSVLILVKCVFCGKYYVCSGKFVSIVVKRKYMNSNNISDICDKLNFITNYIHFTILEIQFIKKTHIIIFDTKNTHIIIFYTCDRTVRSGPKYFREL